jgi:2-amino-4-hydroxy-6-hydroxymethyldihydropteridine diphosphokinase
MLKESVIINLGSNLGRKAFNLYNAIKLISSKCKIDKISSVYSSRSLLLDEQENYFNISVNVFTKFSPYSLLDFLKSIEKKMKRVRSGRWKERVIDIDIVDYKLKVINEKDLVLPHYDLQNRSFFLKPVMDICPDYIHPVFGIKVSKMYKNLVYKYEIKEIGELKWP